MFVSWQIFTLIKKVTLLPEDFGVMHSILCGDCPSLSKHLGCGTIGELWWIKTEGQEMQILHLSQMPM